jgi:hypothetical protein
VQRKVKSEQKEAGLNFLYIQPKLRTYLEFLKTPKEPQRPKTQDVGTSRRSALSSVATNRARSRGVETGADKPNITPMADSEAPPLINPKISQMFTEAQEATKKVSLEQSLNISPKTFSLKEEQVHILGSRPHRKRVTREVGGIVYDTPSSMPSPQMTSRLF